MINQPIYFTEDNDPDYSYTHFLHCKSDRFHHAPLPKGLWTMWALRSEEELVTVQLSFMQSGHVAVLVTYVAVDSDFRYAQGTAITKDINDINSVLNSLLSTTIKNY